MKNKRTDVNELGEFALIEHLTKDFISQNTSSVYGIGDDAAVISRDDDHYTLVATDLLIEGIHFDLMYTPLKHLGYKSVIVNLSDIYAMNGLPQQITVSIAISNKYSVEALEELYDGIKLACKLYDVDLVGGDTTSNPKGMAISVTAVGTVKKDKVVYRCNAKEGDIICVTGNLGSAYLGLQILEREKQLYLDNPGIQPELDDQKYLIERQLKPEARRDSVAYFDKYDILPTAMIDVSDGLSSELFHIATQSKVGILIEEAKVPIHDEAQMKALDFRMDPITTALSGGEDYELLFTIDPKDLEKIRYMPDLAIIGEVMKEEHGLKILTTGNNLHDLLAQGWKHFTDKKKDPSKEN